MREETNDEGFLLEFEINCTLSRLEDMKARWLTCGARRGDLIKYAELNGILMNLEAKKRRIYGHSSNTDKE